MGQLLIPPYEDFKNNTERWQRHQRQVRLQRMAVPVLVVLFLAVVVIWVLAFGGRD